MTTADEGRAGRVEAPADRAAGGTTKHVFATLDGLRGVAALAVVAFHYEEILGPLVFPSAYLAVDLFFLISGIVIAHAYERRLAGGMTVRGFMTKRIARLMPLYLAGLGIAAATAVLGLLLGQSHWTWATLLPVVLWCAMMLPNIFPAPRADLYPLDIPCWSLYWELVINLAYAGAVRWLRPPVLVAMVVIAEAALAVAGWHAGGLDYGANWQRPEIGLLRVIAGFSMGILLARLFAAGTLWRLRAPPVLILLLAAVLLALPMSLGWAKDVACVALGFPLLCIAGLNSEPRVAAPYLWLGLISYPLYVIHATLPWRMLTQMLLHVPPEVFAPWSGLSAVIAAVILAWSLARLYDEPVRRWLARRTSPRHETVTAPAADR